MGAVIDAAGNYFPACWTISRVNGVQSELKLLPVGPFQRELASDVNDNGEIVGWGVSADGSRNVGLYWANAEAVPKELLPLAGDDIGAVVLAINNGGVICGRSVHQVTQGDWRDQAVVWRVSPSGDVYGPVELPPAQSQETTTAAAISDNGDTLHRAKVVGWSSQSAVAWTVQSNDDGTITIVDSQARVLGDGDVGEASGVNNAGMICGSIAGWGVVWTNESTPTTLAYNSYVGGKPLDINNNGMSVGWGWYQRKLADGPRAVMWPSPSGSLVMLDQFLGDGSPFGCLTFAYAVNDSGEIVGNGWDGNIYTAFVAVPKNSADEQPLDDDVRLRLTSPR